MKTLPSARLCLMQSLSTELHLKVQRYLPDTALSALSKTCKFNHELTIPLLHEEFAITLRIEPSNISPTQKINSYSVDNWERCKYLRFIVITCWEPLAWRYNGLMMLDNLRVLLINLTRTRLKSFVWDVEFASKPNILRYLPPDLELLDTDASLIDHSRPFQKLNDLKCWQLARRGTANEFLQQLMHVEAHLRCLCISLDPSAALALSPWVVEELHFASTKKFAFGQLKSLTLHNMYIEQWPFRDMRCIETLSLQKCPHVDQALAKYVLDERHDFARLRTLRLFLCTKSVFILEVLQHLQGVTELEELQIFTQESAFYPIDWILPFHKTLNRLVLESRQLWADSTSVYPCPAQGFLSILEACTSLRSLGIPVLIEETLPVRTS